MSHGLSPQEQAAQDARIKNQLERIKYPIVVMSGKGGVGKSTVAVNLAYSLAVRGYRVGIMDIDVHGPNVPKMLGIANKEFEGTETTIDPVPVLPNLLAVSLGLIGYDPDHAIVWRGPIKIGLIKQFLADVTWGELDYLIIDTPPGTGDENLTVAQVVTNLAGAVVVTTPQEVAVLDSRKSLSFARKLDVPVIGLIENMAGFVCPCCQTVSYIFRQGGGQKAATDFGVPFLGEVPIDPRVVEAGDAGTPFLGLNSESPTTAAMAAVVDKILDTIAINESQGLYEARKAKAKAAEPDPGFRPER